LKEGEPQRIQFAGCCWIALTRCQIHQAPPAVRRTSRWQR
jgi:hypothetical protein